MKKKIYSISWLWAVLAMVTFGFTACGEDDDDNPTLDLSHVEEGFVLNVPANAENNTYDLVNSTSLELTCSQPNYGGVPYAVRYYVQVSLDSDFSDYIELSTSYTSAKMDVDASEINDAMVELYQNANPDTDYPAEARALYVKLRAILANTDNLGETYSNQITLPSVLASYQAPAAEFVEQLYVCGSSIQDAWSSWKVVPPIYGVSGEYYTMIYCGAGDSFKWGTYEQDWRGYTRLTAINDEAGAGVSSNDDDNIVIGTAGWYTLYFVATISGSSVTYELTISNAEAGVIGAAFDGGAWSEGCLMTAPSDASGLWESPEADGSGELRAYIKVASYDWWRTEFTLYNGELYWRLVDIADNWETNVGADYSVQVSAGQKLYVDFNYNTGEVK